MARSTPARRASSSTACCGVLLGWRCQAMSRVIAFSAVVPAAPAAAHESLEHSACVPTRSFGKPGSVSSNAPNGMRLSAGQRSSGSDVFRGGSRSALRAPSPQVLGEIDGGRSRPERCPEARGYGRARAIRGGWPGSAPGVRPVLGRPARPRPPESAWRAAAEHADAPTPARSQACASQTASPTNIASRARARLVRATWTRSGEGLLWSTSPAEVTSLIASPAPRAAPRTSSSPGSAELARTTRRPCSRHARSSRAAPGSGRSGTSTPSTAPHAPRAHIGVAWSRSAGSNSSRSWSRPMPMARWIQAIGTS